MGARIGEVMAGALLLGALATVHAAFLTYGTGDLLQGELHGDAFDSLGRSLLRGEATVDGAAIGNEARIRDGRTYMYFGPWPALLRMPANALFPGMEGEWSRLSCLLASQLCVLGFAALVRSRLARNVHVPRGLGRLLSAFSVIAFALGSPLLHLVSYGAIYHESILWGLAASVWAIRFLFPLIEDENTPIAAAVGFSVCTGVALLSRVTFALPLLLVGAVLGLAAMRASWLRQRAGGRLSPAPLFALAVPVLCALLFQAWYNHARWDSVLVFVDEEAWVQTWFGIGDFPQFSAARIPGAFSNYFGLVPPYFSWTAPYIHIGTATNLIPELYSKYREPVMSLTVTTPWLLIGGLAGLAVGLRGRATHLARLSALAFAAEALTLLMFFAVVHRYAADFLPLFVFGFGLLLARLRPGARSRRVRAGVLGLFLAACVYSVPANLLPTLTWTAYWNLDAPEEAREGLKRRFEAADSARRRLGIGP